VDECKPLIDGGASDTPAKLVVEDCEIINSAATFIGGSILQLGTSHLEAGAYTRPLFSSTCAVSDTKYTLHNLSYSLTPPQHPLSNPCMHPLYHRNRVRGAEQCTSVSPCLEVTRTLIHTTSAWMATYGAAVGPAPKISKYPWNMIA